MGNTVVSYNKRLFIIMINNPIETKHKYFLLTVVLKVVSILNNLDNRRQGFSQKGVQASFGRPLFKEIQGKFT